MDTTATVSTRPFPKLAAFSKLAAGAAAALVLAASMGSGYSDWRQSSISEMNHWQSQGVLEGIFTGTAKADTSFADLRGTYASINPIFNTMPVIHKELFMNAANKAFHTNASKKYPDLYAKMTYDHERSHVEYQTAMPSRFDAPGLSPKDRQSIENGLDLNDRGAYSNLRGRMHGAMHERFAEIYSGMAMVREAAPGDDGRIHAFLVERSGIRHDVDFLSKHVFKEFAHELGTSMDAVVAMDPAAIKAMSPNQMKAAALRAASLAYLADAKNDPELSGFLDRSLSGPASQALWAKAGSMTGPHIAERALANLPAPAPAEIDMASIAHLKFGSNAKYTSQQVAPDSPTLTRKTPSM